jgi:hypothetical protein
MAPRGPNDEEGVVDPDDLDITKNERVHELRDGQYVIATENATVEDLDVDPDPADPAEDDASDPPDDADHDRDPRAALIDHLSSVSAAHGVVVAGRFDGAVRVHETTSDDPGAVFRDLLTWYATNVDGGTPTPEVLGILCLAGEVQVRYPLRTVADLLRAHDLSPDDSIRDLVEAVRAEGVVLPPDDD